MTDFLLTALVLASFGLSEAALGPRGFVLRSVLALAALAPVLIHLGAGSSLRSRRPVLALAGCLLGLILWWPDAGASRHFALGACLAFLSAGSALGTALSLTAVSYGAFVTVRDHLSLWPVLMAISTGVTSTIASVLGMGARLGPSYSGMWPGAALGIAVLARCVVARVGFPKRMILPAGLLLLAPLVTVGLAGAPLQFLHWRIFQFFYLLIPLWLFLRAQPWAAPHRGDAPRWSSRAAGAGLHLAPITTILAGLTLLAWNPAVSSGTGRVLIDARGEFDLRPPQWGTYGADARQGASLATLPPLLRAYGFSVSMSDSVISEARLAECDAFVVMNPKQVFQPSERQAIWAFVRRGGGLFVLGDHTNIKGVMEPVNTLLEPVGVRLEFDSAIPLVPRWTWYGCMRAHPLAVTRGIRDESDIRVSVGASLHLPPGVLPLITGRDAFSDPGNAQNARGAYLGNMQYDPGETVGDLPLAALASFGRGKVIVFGDTSLLQRSATLTSHEFVIRLFEELVSPGEAPPPLPVRGIGAVLMLAGLIMCALSGARLVPVLAVAGLLGAAGLRVLESHGPSEVPPLPSPENVAWLDLAHGNRLDLHAGLPNSLTGLEDHLLRCGYLPLGMKRFDARKVEAAGIFVTIAPAFPFSLSEAASLAQFVERGGYLVVSCGFLESHGVRSLLSEFGYDIGNTPIGAAHQSETHVEGQRAAMHESWPVLRPEGRGEVLVSCWGYPLAVLETIGQGKLLVIGDSYFLGDVSLENSESYVETNINFLRAVLGGGKQASSG